MYGDYRLETDPEPQATTRASQKKTHRSNPDQSHSNHFHFL
jgi:hypothetical protein